MSNDIMKAKESMFVARKVASASTGEYHGDIKEGSMDDYGNVTFCLTLCDSNT